MGYYYITTRQQFIIPTTPIGTFPSSSLACEEDDGTAIPSNTYTDGDSYITRYWLSEGGGNWNFKFMIDSDYLPDPADYFVCTSSLTDVAGELVMQITKFVNLVPYPSYRVRIDLSPYPYTNFSVAPITTEADITKVTFSQSLNWTGVKFGITPFGRSYWFCKLKGYAFPRIPFPLFGLSKSFPVGTSVEQFH